MWSLLMLQSARVKSFRGPKLKQFNYKIWVNCKLLPMLRVMVTY